MTPLAAHVHQDTSQREDDVDQRISVPQPFTLRQVIFVRDLYKTLEACKIEAPT